MGAEEWEKRTADCGVCRDGFLSGEAGTNGERHKGGRAMETLVQNDLRTEEAGTQGSEAVHAPLSPLAAPRRGGIEGLGSGDASHPLPPAPSPLGGEGEKEGGVNGYGQRFQAREPISSWLYFASLPVLFRQSLIFSAYFRGVVSLYWWRNICENDG